MHTVVLPSELLLLSMEKQALHGSNNYIWSDEDILGHGSMGRVYVARHRRIGDKYAVKVFNQELKLMSKDYVQNELDILQRIPDHENIIKTIDVEIQRHTQDKVVIMEYCDGGSLQDILNKPENYFGLREDEFLLFFFQIGRAICYLHEHGIVHRDIKPGNIVLSISPDNSHVYKITDFGTSKCCDKEHVSFRSLTGTEEYLHPDLHLDIFIKKKSAGSYDAHVDLWSFGVTIYQCGTGNFPFVPLGGIKSDRHKMQSLMRQKQPGVISQREMPNKSIFSSQHLPDKCYLTRGTKRKIENFLIKLFDLTTRITTSEFAQQLRSFQEQLRVYVFDAASGLLSTFYINRSAKLHDLKQKISRITGVPADALQLFWDFTLLDSNDDGLISQWLRTSERNPLMVLSHPGHPSPSEPICCKDVELSENRNNDVNWAKEICGTMYFIEDRVKGCVTIQEHMACLERLLQTSSEYRMKMARLKYDNLRSMLELVEFFKEHHSDQLDDRILKLDEIRRHIYDLDKRMRQSCSIARTYPVCQQSRCWHKARKIIQDSEVLTQSIHDKGEALISHNENELLRYNKSELRRKYRKMTSLLCEHCSRQTSHLHSKLQQPIKWYETITDTEKIINASELRIEKLKFGLKGARFDVIASRLGYMIPVPSLQVQLPACSNIQKYSDSRNSNNVGDPSSGIHRVSTSAACSVFSDKRDCLSADELNKCKILAENVNQRLTENTELIKLLVKTS